MQKYDVCTLRFMDTIIYCIAYSLHIYVHDIHNTYTIYVSFKYIGMMCIYCISQGYLDSLLAQHLRYIHTRLYADGICFQEKLRSWFQCFRFSPPDAPIRSGYMFLDLCLSLTKMLAMENLGWTWNAMNLCQINDLSKCELFEWLESFLASHYFQESLAEQESQWS